MTTRLIFAVLLVACVLEGCSSRNTGLPGDDKVRAEVEGQPITDYDIDLAVLSTLGSGAAGKLDEKQRRPVLESLVASRLMARKMEAQLDDQHKAALERSVAAYREKLLVEQYLAKNAPPAPANDEAVERYYQEHLSQFGALATKTYEMLATTRALIPTERTAFLEAAKTADQQPDWGALAEALRQQGLPVTLRQGEVKASLLHRSLLSKLEGLDKGQPAVIAFVDGKAHLARIVEVQRTEPKPLSEVSGEIRNKLEATSLREAIGKASKQVLVGAKVVYL
ncbi:MAG: peptidylprolyl isomerase [Myxococcota bacterium]|nr:peptidylprolyl isomerase [Myxococcota bacterium]